MTLKERLADDMKSAMKNKDTIIVGITNGLAGYAVGNYLGYLIYQLLTLL